MIAGEGFDPKKTEVWQWLIKPDDTEIMEAAKRLGAAPVELPAVGDRAEQPLFARMAGTGLEAVVRHAGQCPPQALTLTGPDRPRLHL